VKIFDLVRATFILEQREKGKTLREISAMIGLSFERIRQIEARALWLLKDKEKKQAFIKRFLEEISYIKNRYPQIDDTNRGEVYDQIDKVLYDTPVWDIELTVRSASALKNQNLRTLGEVVQKTRREMLDIHNFGKKSLIELEGELAKYGLRLGMKLKWGYYAKTEET
jgi:DNA-directed RNA polymerase alpha subunit